jgi:hypothetical protein
MASSFQFICCKVQDMYVWFSDRLNIIFKNWRQPTHTTVPSWAMQSRKKCTLLDLQNGYSRLMQQLPLTFPIPLSRRMHNRQAEAHWVLCSRNAARRRGRRATVLSKAVMASSDTANRANQCVVDGYLRSVDDQWTAKSIYSVPAVRSAGRNRQGLIACPVVWNCQRGIWECMLVTDGAVRNRTKMALGLKD